MICALIVPEGTVADTPLYSPETLGAHRRSWVRTRPPFPNFDLHGNRASTDSRPILILPPSSFTSFPPGVLNTVPSLGSVGGAALSAHKDVDKIAFTGSTVTGRKIMTAAAQSNLKKVSLELGGKSPQLIFESADLDQGTSSYTTPVLAVILHCANLLALMLMLTH